MNQIQSQGRKHLRTVNHDVITWIPDTYIHVTDFLTDHIAQGNHLKGVDLVHLVRQWHTLSVAGVNFSNVDMSECHAAHLDFSGCDLTRTILRHSNLRACVMRECIMAGTILDAVNLHSADLTGSLLVAAPQTPGHRTRHVLRPQIDEFLPWDRVLARTADFEDACLDQCVITQVDFTGAQFENSSLQDCLIEKCTFEGSIFTGATLNRSHVYRSNLVSPTLCEVQAQHAVFRTNEYVEMPVPRTIAESAWHFPRQLITYVKEEAQHGRKLPTEIRTDYARQLVFKFLVLCSVPMLALLAWKYVETNAVLGLITAMGAVSTFALRRYFTMALQSLFGFAFGKVNDAEGLWRSGVRGKSLVKAVFSSMITTKLMQLRRNNRDD